MSVKRQHRVDERKDNKLLLLKHSNFLLALYAAGVAGALILILGGQWDVSLHVLGLVETFFAAPHTVLYSGVAFSLLSSLIALAYYQRILLFDREKNRFLFDILAGKRLPTARQDRTAAVGGLILTAVLLGPVGTFLDSWHSVALWIESDQLLLSWIIPVFAGGFAGGLIWIGLNKTLLNILITTRVHSTDSGNNPMLQTEKKGTKKE